MIGYSILRLKTVSLDDLHINYEMRSYYDVINQKLMRIPVKSDWSVHECSAQGFPHKNKNKIDEEITVMTGYQNIISYRLTFRLRMRNFIC